MAVVVINLVENRRQQFSLQLNNVLRPGDEPHFQIERIVFCEVPAGGMRLCAINVTGLIDALEPSNTVFFVELRALRQISDAFKIFDLKQVRTTFRSGGYDFRSHDFRKMVAIEELPEEAKNGCLYLENAAKPLIANCQGTVIEQNFSSYRFNVT